ncbi:MAG: type VI secretion system baseplate subunit TssG [Pyrinomonadaceae bacterium]|nr:type VI secretion system baseplate subunit TssG [Blastocatellia bacterium]MCW5955515.1 type VI secretion system baseplate subunit TssG [Pyrinomonadaceae bacterium]
MKDKPLDQLLFDEPFRFEFFQAVRLLEKIFPDRKPVGGSALPTEEVVRFRSYVALDFPPSEIREFLDAEDPISGQQRKEMVMCVMGMVGVSGVLPTHYTELVLDRVRHRDTAMWSFLDLFTHRAASLFYRAWAKYRFPVGYERGNDEFTSYLFDLAGLGTSGLQGRMDLEDESLLPYVGLIAQKPHSSDSIEKVVSDYFGITAKADQFSGQWLELSEGDRTKLGSQNCSLGLNTIAGTKVWDQQSKFRLKLGPLEFKKFQAFLPNGSASKPLRSILDFMIGLELDYDVQLILAKQQVPSNILTTRALRRPMLGWTTFLKTRPFTKDDRQLILQTTN